MNSEFKLAMQLTMVDMLSGAAQVARRNILAMGDAGKSVARDFDLMQTHITRGLKSIAVANYGIDKLKPGVAAAADMQEELHKVEMNLANSTENAASLHKQLQSVKDTANFIGQNSPFTSQQIVGMEAQLLKSGINFKDVTGQRGVTWNAAGLAALSGNDPRAVGESLAKIGQTFGFTKGEQYSEISNWLEKAESSAGHDLGQLFYGMKMSGNSAKALGISPKDLTTMLTMAAPLGDMAGTSVNRFMDRLAGGHREERKYLKYMGLDFFDAKSGKFKGASHALDEVRTKFGAIANDKNKLILFEKIFGEEGKRFAEIVAQSKLSFQEFDAFVHSHKDITEKQEIWATGFNASWIKLVTTIKSTGASLFDPLLNPLTKANDLINNLTGSVGAFAEEHKGFAKTISYGAGGVAVGAGLYGLYNLARGGLALSRVLSTLGPSGLIGNIGRTGFGIAEGKAVQTATGVNPVFVTNWPANLGWASGGGAIPPIIPPGGGKILPWLKNIGMGAATFSGTTVLAAGAALAFGYAVGTAIEKTFINGKIGERIYDNHHGPFHQDKSESMLRDANKTFNSFAPPGKHGSEWYKPKNDIKIDLKIDGKGGVFSSTNDLDTTINTLPRGSFFGGTQGAH
jgi:TP901 family phage tail tape measure protein